MDDEGLARWDNTGGFAEGFYGHRALKFSFRARKSSFTSENDIDVQELFNASRELTPQSGR